MTVLSLNRLKICIKFGVLIISFQYPKKQTQTKMSYLFHIYLPTYLLTYLTHIGSSYLWNYIELCINTYWVLRGDLHRDLSQESFLEGRSKRMSKEASQGIGWEGEVHIDGRISRMRFVWGNLYNSRDRYVSIRIVPIRQAPRVWW